MLPQSAFNSDAFCRQELFRKTVGPLREAFLIYNSQGRSKGMAVVSFQRPGDAGVAREKYDGKFIDGSKCTMSMSFMSHLVYDSSGRPIKIEVVLDSDNTVVKAPPAQTQPSLLGRLGGIFAANAAPAIPAHNHAPNGSPVSIA
jgi:THO complex subunit 4